MKTQSKEILYCNTLQHTATHCITQSLSKTQTKETLHLLMGNRSLSMEYRALLTEYKALLLQPKIMKYTPTKIVTYTPARWRAVHEVASLRDTPTPAATSTFTVAIWVRFWTFPEYLNVCVCVCVCGYICVYTYISLQLGSHSGHS